MDIELTHLVSSQSVQIVPSLQLVGCCKMCGGTRCVLAFVVAFVQLSQFFAMGTRVIQERCSVTLLNSLSRLFTSTRCKVQMDGKSRNWCIDSSDFINGSHSMVRTWKCYFWCAVLCQWRWHIAESLSVRRTFMWCCRSQHWLSTDYRQAWTLRCFSAGWVGTAV